MPIIDKASELYLLLHNRTPGAESHLFAEALSRGLARAMQNAWMEGADDPMKFVEDWFARVRTDW